MVSLSPAKVIHKSAEDNLKIIVISICGLIWPNPPLLEYHTSTIYMGDLNSHHTDFRYIHNDENGNQIHDWILLNQYHLILNLKDPKTYHAHNTSGTNPDLCILNDFPNSHHSPVLWLSESMCPSFNLCLWIGGIPRKLIGINFHVVWMNC